MATESLSELIKTVTVGEDGDQAFVRLYGSQVKPCDFRRWFTQVKLTGASLETDEATIAKIKEYLADELTVDEAFKDFCPDYVGPGEFSVAYTKQVKILKATTEAPVAVVDQPKTKKGKAAPVEVPESLVESPLEPAIVPSEVSTDVTPAV
jgi:hypothetical protein